MLKRIPIIVESLFSDEIYKKIFFICSCFILIVMSFLSNDYGVSGDEYVDHIHSGYVIDYFTKGDTAALYQPKTVLHLYGNVVQVLAAGICDVFSIDDYYELRHIMSSIVGGVGIIFAGLLAMRLTGGLGGVLTLLLMFFTPRYFGHSMNNLKDVPFAVGYLMTLYYTILLFDYFPKFKKRNIIGVILGIALALGTRSGGLVLYPMLFMYAGLFYIQKVGISEFYKFVKYWSDVKRIFIVLLIVVFGSYLLSILLWPYALQDPFTNVVKSLKEFTNFSIGLRTIFDGKQMMSTMLVWYYAPKYLLIGVPIVSIVGFFGYIIMCIIKRKEFSLMSFWLLFAIIFPIFWVVYKNANLYGGIRHLLFVMPPLVVLAGCFWSQLIINLNKKKRFFIIIVFSGLLLFPIVHTIKNHPNQYVYFNEFVGGLNDAYGDYETDYYYNSLKESADWFKENVELPKNKITIIATNHSNVMQYYFRNMPNVKVIYSRFYNKYSVDWDYAIFGNVYINKFQLKNNLFPPPDAMFAPTVDGFPMSYVIKRESKDDLKGFELDKANDFIGVINVFSDYIKKYEYNEEAWAKLGKAYFLTKQISKADWALNNALALHPTLVEAAYYKVLCNIEQKKYIEALKTVDVVLDENNTQFNFWYLKASIYAKTNQPQQAIECINKVISFNPQFYLAYDLAGDIFVSSNQLDAASKMYSIALKYKKVLDIYKKLRDVFVKQGKHRESEQLTRIIEANI